MVDLSIQGDWGSAQVRLGLLDERVTPEPNWFQAEACAGGEEIFPLPDDAAQQEVAEERRQLADERDSRKKARKQAKATKQKQRKPKKKKRK